jgi:hypothetical protein
LAWVQRVNQPLYRAYLLKEHLGLIFQLPVEEALAWLVWAFRSRLEPFVVAAGRIATHIEALIATLEHRLSNVLVEAVNTRIRLIIRRTYGFHSAPPLIALAMLTCDDCCPVLPRSGRMTHGNVRSAQILWSPRSDPMAESNCPLSPATRTLSWTSSVITSRLTNSDGYSLDLPPIPPQTQI